jgi:hypothetical protein
MTQRHRSTISVFVLLAGMAMLAPAGAYAGGPLLSGYGGPGAGAQMILGATLVNGPSGGSSGGSGGGSAGHFGGGTSYGGSQNAAGGARAGGPSGSAANARPATGPASGSGGRSTRTAGAGTSAEGSSASSNQVSQAVSGGIGASWFPAADVELLVLAAGVLALLALATARLAHTHHD